MHARDELLASVPRVHGIDVSLGGMPQIDKELHRTRPTALLRASQEES